MLSGLSGCAGEWERAEVHLCADDVASPPAAVDYRIHETQVVVESNPEVFLASVPVEEIEVSVSNEGVRYSFLEDLDWVFQPSRNAILFNEYWPDVGATIELVYHTRETLDQEEAAWQSSTQPCD